MPRLIDADANVVAIRVAIKRMKQSDNSNWLEGYLDGLDAACNTIEASPTIEAETVKHERWVDVQDFGTGNCYGYCSNCKTMHRANNPTALKMEYRHCRWCGAKMDGGVE